jgi:cell fate regulator YaaT (PSP1 superfamily)
MRAVAGFEGAPETLRRGERCVLRTERGIELGLVLVPPAWPPRKEPPPVRGEILRRATEADIVRDAELSGPAAAAELALARRTKGALGLGGKIVALEHLFGGEKVIVYFKAEGRIDVRPLAAALGAELRTRVELRQVSAREEVRLLGDLGMCGQPECARRFATIPGPVTLRAVAVQREALFDRSKLAGRSGLLKECLAFEEERYRTEKSAAVGCGLERPPAPPAGPGPAGEHEQQPEVLP